MFRVEFLVDDKHLVKMHHALRGLKVFNLTAVPVVNAKVKGGKVREVDAGPISWQIVPALRKRFPKGGRINLKEIYEVIRQLGGTPSTGHLNGLVRAKQLRRAERGIYVLAQEKK